MCGGSDTSEQRLQPGVVEGLRQSIGFLVAAGTLCARCLTLSSLLLAAGLQLVLGQVLAAGAEGVVEGGGEAGDVRGDVGEDLWRRLVIVTD